MWMFSLNIATLVMWYPEISRLVMNGTSSLVRQFIYKDLENLWMFSLNITWLAMWYTDLKVSYYTKSLLLVRQTILLLFNLYKVCNENPVNAVVFFILYVVSVYIMSDNCVVRLLAISSFFVLLLLQHPPPNMWGIKHRCIVYWSSVLHIFRPRTIILSLC